MVFINFILFIHLREAVLLYSPALQPSITKYTLNKGVKMNKKLVLVVFVAFIVLSSMGMSYASDKDVSFIICGTDDNEVVENVGDVIASINGAGDLIVSLLNAYPGYEANVTFKIKYTDASGGEDPVYIKAITINNGNQSKIDVVVTDPASNSIQIDTILYPDGTLDGLLTVTILDGAEQSVSYSFGVDIDFSEEPPISIS